jgi:Trk-type K+ transport system membrane component
MTANELFEMVDALEIPESIITPSGSVFSGIEALCLTCAHFCTAGDLHKLSMKHYHAQSAISEIVNWLVTLCGPIFPILTLPTSSHLPTCRDMPM